MPTLANKKASRYFVDHIVKVFVENSKINPSIECQLGMSKNVRSLDQNQMFVGKGKEGCPNFKLFRGRHK